jgi:hypothetical protein
VLAAFLGFKTPSSSQLWRNEEGWGNDIIYVFLAAFWVNTSRTVRLLAYLDEILPLNKPRDLILKSF